MRGDIYERGHEHLHGVHGRDGVAPQHEGDADEDDEDGNAHDEHETGAASTAFEYGARIARGRMHTSGGLFHVLPHPVANTLLTLYNSHLRIICHQV